MTQDKAAAAPAENQQPKSFKGYLMNKMIIGYGLINGLINAGIFYLIHKSQPGATFGASAIMKDMALTGFLLGILLFAIVLPLTRTDFKKHPWDFPSTLPKHVGLIPRNYVAAMLVLGVIVALGAVAVSALFALILQLPLTVMQAMIFKGFCCTLAGAAAGYYTIMYALRGWLPQSGN